MKNVTHLFGVTEKMMNKYKATERKLESKHDVSDVKPLDIRIQHLQKKIKKYITSRNIDSLPLKYNWSRILWH